MCPRWSAQMAVSRAWIQIRGRTRSGNLLQKSVQGVQQKLGAQCRGGGGGGGGVSVSGGDGGAR